MPSAMYLFRAALTLISPKLNNSVVYLVKKKRRMNWKEPRSFTEQLVKLRITDYNHNPLVKRCADKYAVRAYVEEHGLKELLNPLLFAFDRPEELPWDELPQRFALKLNYGCGCNLIVSDKQEHTREELVSLMRGWLRKKPWLGYAELQYKDVPAKFLVEQYLEGKHGRLPEDYKLYCFHGKPEAILYMQGRNSEEMRVGFFDPDWQYLGKPDKNYKEFTPETMPQPPASLAEMNAAAAILSAPFPFVRMDFFEVDGRAVFGEMTFSPAAGFDVSEISVHGKSMGELLAR